MNVSFWFQIRGYSPWHPLVSFPPWSNEKIRPSGCLHCATKRGEWSNIIMNEKLFSLMSSPFSNIISSLNLVSAKIHLLGGGGLILIFHFHSFFIMFKVFKKPTIYYFPYFCKCTVTTLNNNVKHIYTMKYSTESWYSASGQGYGAFSPGLASCCQWYRSREGNGVAHGVVCTFL